MEQNAEYMTFDDLEIILCEYQKYKKVLHDKSLRKKYELSMPQMFEVVSGLCHQVAVENVRTYAHKAYTWQQMRVIRISYEKKFPKEYICAGLNRIFP